MFHREAFKFEMNWTKWWCKRGTYDFGANMRISVALETGQHETTSNLSFSRQRDPPKHSQQNKSHVHRTAEATSQVYKLTSLFRKRAITRGGCRVGGGGTIESGKDK